MMALGLPVNAGPVPAYFDVIDSGRNAYLADTPQERQQALSALRDPAHRAEMGAAARLAVLDRLSKERQVQALLHLLAPWMPSGR